MLALAGVAVAVAVAVALSGCGGSGSGSAPSITVGAARTYRLAGFQPSGPVPAGRPTTIAFTILQPDGKPLTAFRHGAGPHNGVHLILVRRDLGLIVHRHPPIGPDGRIVDRVTLPAPGPYRVVVDAYPAPTGPSSQTNFQLFGTLRVAGAYRPQPLPAPGATETVAGYRFALGNVPRLKAIEPALLDVRVTAPDRKPASFTPWYGALAHAIFFRAGSLDYFHTHVCAPGASGCTSVFGGAKVTGTSSTPGRLRVGVLFPVPGTWRLFLQCQVGGRILTAPFTLKVS